MKNNLILGVECLKKMLKGIFLVVGLFMIVVANAKNMSILRQTSSGTTGTTTQQQRVSQSPEGNPTVSLRTVSNPSQTSQMISQIPPATAPSMLRQEEEQERQKVHQGVTWVLQQTKWPSDDVINPLWYSPFISQLQKDQLTNYYNKLMARKTAEQPSYISSTKTGGAMKESQQSVSGLINQAWEGAKSRATAVDRWGRQKGKEALEYAKALPGASWGYQASIPTSTKVTSAMTAALAVPALGIAAPGVVTMAAVGAAGYTTLSLIDRLEHRYRTGHWTSQGALKFEKMKLEQLISDSGKYPVPTVVAEALQDDIFETPTEESLTGDQFKISKNARTMLIEESGKKLEKDQDLKTRDTQVKHEIDNIRSQYGYDQKQFNAAFTKQDKIDYLNKYKFNIESWFDVHKMMAAMSEYSRTLSKLQVLEEYKKAESEVKPVQ